MLQQMDAVSRNQPRPVSLWIGDQRLERASGGTYAHVNPVTGEVQADIPLAGVDEMKAAVAAAAAAYPAWRNWRPGDRRDALMRLSKLIEEHADEFARLGSLENGTPVSLGWRAWQRAKNWIGYYAGWCDKLEGGLAQTFDRDGQFSYWTPEPYGVIGIIITWNGPLISLGQKVAPAIAAGNCVVVKPSEMTPFVPDLFMELVLKAGIPPGVVNMMPGAVAAGEALVRHPKVGKITFTGGPAAARRILADCAQSMKPAVLELGGKSANIIFPDCNLDAVCQWSAFFSIGLMAGQGCALPTRLLVHESIHDEVVERVTAAAKALKYGDPWDPATVMGPVVNQAARDRVLGIIERAQEQQAGRMLCGGKAADRPGFFIEPTVFADVDPHSDLALNEVFGPVLSIMRFRDEDHAVEMANATDYGLGAYIQTRDVARVHRMSERLNAGSIWVNGGMSLAPNVPFGGYGLSGYGVEGGAHGINEFLRPKTVTIGTMS